MDDDRIISPADSNGQPSRPDAAPDAETEQPGDDEYIPVAVFEYDESGDADEDDGIYISNASRMRTHLEKEGITEQKKYKKKLNFIQWIEDIFYHHKTDCIVAACIVVIIAVIALLNMDGKSYDYTFAVYTYEAEVTDEQLSEIAEAFARYGEDVDGDGEVTVDIRHYRPYTGRYFQQYHDAQKVYHDIYGERSDIFILTDAQCRDGIIERFSNYHFERLCGDERWVSLEGTEFCQMDETDALGTALGLMMFRPGTYAVDLEDVQLRHKQAEAMMIRIAADYPELFDFEA